MSQQAANFHRQMMQRTIQQGGMNTNSFTCKWRTLTGTPGNPYIESSQGNEVWTDHSETVTAFIHYVDIAQSAYQRHSEVRNGDIILDFPHTTDFSGRRDIQFIIGGITYVQAEVGRDLEQSWDARCGGTPICLTLLVRPQGRSA